MVLLPPADYCKAAKSLIDLSINHLFALSIIEQKVSGKIYADETENPSTFLFVHPYGMSLLTGNENNDDFNAEFKKYALNCDKSRTKTEWLQAFPASWNEKLSSFFGNSLVPESENTGINKAHNIELSTRVNFKFNEEKYRTFKTSFDFKPYEIVRTTEQLFENMNGTVVPKYFWNNAEDFYKNAVGFSLIYDGKLASTAFAAFIIGSELELGIETVADYRGKNLALYTCSALIDYCIENNLKPVWACRLENTNSYKTAQKLGFEVSVLLPFYKLVI